MVFNNITDLRGSTFSASSEFYEPKLLTQLVLLRIALIVVLIRCSLKRLLLIYDKHCNIFEEALLEASSLPDTMCPIFQQRATVILL